MKKRAFTLIELLVVISIIAVLMSILIPALSKVRKQGKILVCANNERQLTLAMSVYASDNNGHFVAIFRDAAIGGSDSGNILHRDPAETFRPYLGTEDSSTVWTCPEDREIGLNAYFHYDGERAENTRSYSANGHLVGGLDSPGLGRVKRPTDTIMYSENWTGWSVDDYRGFVSCETYDTLNRWGGEAVFHNTKNQSNFSFVDGHVDFLRWLEVCPDNIRGSGMYLPYKGYK